MTFSLQDLVTALPEPLRRMRVARLLAMFTGRPYHSVRFQSGILVGNVEDAPICNALVRRRWEDYGYYKIASALVPEGGVHVDAGANYGFYTFGLLDRPSAGTVRYLLIDANPDCVHCHLLTLKFYSGYKITSLNYALSDRPGDVSLTYSPAYSAAGFLGEDAGGSMRTIGVPAQTLDDILDGQGIESIDLLKMDIEGSEVAALRGAARHLARSSIRGIYIEVNSAALLRQGTSLQELFQIFKEHGYRLFWPHSAMDWILMQYNNQAITVDEINIFEHRAKAPLVLAEFNPAFCLPLETGQFDLLAFPERIASGFTKIKSALATKEII